MCYKCIDIMLKNSKKKNWDEASLEWIKGYREKCENEKCICGHPISYKYLIKNLKTKKKLWLGSKCIINSFKKNKKLIEFVKYYTCPYCDVKLLRNSEEKHRKSKKHLNNYELCKKIFNLCKSCIHYTADKARNHHLCWLCYSDKKGYAECIKCKNKKEIYKDTLCYECWDLLNGELLIISDDDSE